jgi:hypothetical protein
MDSGWTRREFLARAAASATSLPFAGTAETVHARAAGPSHMRGRFLTHVSVVRVNQIEVTPNRSIGEDESIDNHPDRIRPRREAFAAGCPDGRMTWAISWLALHDRRREFQEARRLLASYHDRFGDEITFIPGGYFARMYDTREHNRQTIHKALDQISEMVGNGYRPQSLVAGFMDAENQRLLAADEGIHVCQGQIWSQHGIDHGDGDGGICYPYYPSREHYLKPARVRKILLTVFAWTDGPATFWQLGGKDFKAVSIAGWAWDRSRPWGTSEQSPAARRCSTPLLCTLTVVMR